MKLECILAGVAGGLAVVGMRWLWNRWGQGGVVFFNEGWSVLVARGSRRKEFFRSGNVEMNPGSRRWWRLAGKLEISRYVGMENPIS